MGSDSEEGRLGVIIIVLLGWKKGGGRGGIVSRPAGLTGIPIRDTRYTHYSIFNLRFSHYKVRVRASFRLRSSRRSFLQGIFSFRLSSHEITHPHYYTNSFLLSLSLLLTRFENLHTYNIYKMVKRSHTSDSANSSEYEHKSDISDEENEDDYEDIKSPKKKSPPQFKKAKKLKPPVCLYMYVSSVD